MPTVPFTIANNWAQYPELAVSANWQIALNEGNIMFQAPVGKQVWSVRLNDFPAEPCYTLLIDGNEIIHFDDWPSFWQRPPFP